MCEIAILDPDRYSYVELSSAAMEVYNAMGDSLGLVGIVQGDDAYKFEVYKATKPSAPDVNDWMQGVADDAERILIHGRLATQGACNIQNSHPLKIDCGECDADFVMHNGAIFSYERVKKAVEADGHNIHTDVDSEVIAHQFGGVPDFGDVYKSGFEREPAFIVGNGSEVYVFTEGRYQLTQDMRLSLPYRDFGPSYHDQDASYTEAKMTHPSEAN
jgi:hypothetical protein